MSIPLDINGVVYDYPETDDQDWGPDATDWASAVTTGMLQKAGGLFQLLDEVDFGSAFGLKSLYYKSRTANTADAGQIRFARADVLNWRNQANDGNLSLGVSASDVLQFNGANIQGEISVSDTSTIDLTLSSNVLSAAIVAGSITNSMINAAAAIAYSKLNLSASIANSDLVVMAESTIKGRAASSGTGAPVDLSATQATAILNNFVGDSGAGGTKGLVPAPAAGDTAAIKFLFADGTWQTPPGAGDVVGPASSANGQIARFGDTSGKLLTATPATISNSDVDASAAIAVSKLAALTASRAVVTDSSGFVSAATTTATEIGYVNGVTSAIQTQLNTKVTNPMTTGGDVIYGGASGTPTRLANGSSGQVLSSSGGTSAPTWATIPGNATVLKAPTRQTLTTGAGATYTTPSGPAPLYLKVRMVGAGGGGAGAGASTAPNGTAGGNTTFDSIVATGGSGGVGSTSNNGQAGGAGGTGGAGSAALRIPGGNGFNGTTTINAFIGGAPGGSSILGFGGACPAQNVAGNAGKNYGGGGSSAGGNAGTTAAGGGGGGGEYVEIVISSPAASYTYTVSSTGGAGGIGTGTNAQTGGAGGAGIIIVDEYYQ